MIRWVFKFIFISTLLTCSGEQRRPVAEDDNFGLDEVDSAPKVDDRGYFGDLQRSDATLGFESSFPLPFAVGKSIDLFETAPEQAKSPGSSQLSVQLGSCRFNLKTGAVQVDRFILAGQWIKLSEALPAGVPVRLEPHMDLNLKLAAKVIIEIPATELAKCKALLAGQRVYIGRFHLNKSKIGLLAGPGYPRGAGSGPQPPSRVAISSARTTRRGLCRSRLAARSGARTRSRSTSGANPTASSSASSRVRRSASNGRACVSIPRAIARRYRPVPPASTATPPAAAIGGSTVAT